MNQPLTVEDLSQMDAYSSQVLTDMKMYSNTLNEEEFAATIDQNFSTVLSHGEEVVLCPQGESRRVQPDNINEFIDLVIKARENEALKQTEAVREGMNTVFGKEIGALSYLTSSALEIRASGPKIIEVESLKAISTYSYCS